NNSVYMPEKHTDFIFATIAEEFGFIGACATIFLFFLLIHRIVIVTLDCADRYAYLMTVGIIGLLTFQIFQNIGMTIGLLPVTGVTLPFLSYGGSSLLSNLLLIGLVHSIRASYEGYMFATGDIEKLPQD
ncbi:MAG: FtsW/RodA/SpoVE family cell cycle protein, partial [Bacilli bacterium]